MVIGLLLMTILMSAFGNAFSYNSSGIIKTINYCHSEGSKFRRYSRYFIQRHITRGNIHRGFYKRCTILKIGRHEGFHAITLRF